MRPAKRCLEVTVGSTSALKENRANNRNDPYAVVRLGSVEYRTDTAGTAGSRPVWNHRFSFLLPDDQLDNPEELHVEVWDHAEGGADKFIGSCSLKLAPVFDRGSMDAVQAVHRKSGKLLGHMRFHLSVLVEDPSPDHDSQVMPPPEKVRMFSAGKPPQPPSKARSSGLPGSQSLSRQPKAEPSESSHIVSRDSHDGMGGGSPGLSQDPNQVTSGNVEAMGELWKHIQLALQQAQIQQLQKELQEQQRREAERQQQQQQQQQLAFSAAMPSLQQSLLSLPQPGDSASQEKLPAGHEGGLLPEAALLPFVALVERLQQAQALANLQSQEEAQPPLAKPQPQAQGLAMPPPRAVPQSSNSTHPFSPAPSGSRGPANSGPSRSGPSRSESVRPKEDEVEEDSPSLDTSGAVSSHAQSLVHMKKVLKPPPLDLTAVTSAASQPSPTSPSLLFKSPNLSCLISPALWSPLPTPPASFCSLFSPTSPFFKSAVHVLKPLPPLTQHGEKRSAPKSSADSDVFSPTTELLANPSHSEGYYFNEPSSGSGHNGSVLHPKALSPKNPDLVAIAQLASSLGPKSQKVGLGSTGSPSFAFPSQDVIAEALSQAFWGAKGGPQPEGGKGPDILPMHVAKPLATTPRSPDKDIVEKEARFASLTRPSAHIPMGGKNSAFSDRRSSSSPPSQSHRSSPPSLKRTGSDELVLDFELGTPHGGTLPREVAPWSEPKRARFAA